MLLSGACLAKGGEMNVLGNTTKSPGDGLRDPVERHRSRLSAWVFGTSFGFIALVAVGLIIFPLIEEMSDEVSESFQESKDIFMAVLPIMSGWVGGVLGFYFSDLAAEARGHQVMQAQGGVAFAERLRQVPVTEVMVDKDRIKKVILKTGPGNDDRLGAGNVFSELIDVVSKKGFTRAPMFTQKGADIYFHAMAHESVIFRYEAKIRAEGKTPDKVSIAEFLESELYLERAAGSTEFVSRSATLEDAKAKMQGNVRGAQDVFITNTGDKNSPVVGWITNVDILRRSVARAED